MNNPYKTILGYLLIAVVAYASKYVYSEIKYHFLSDKDKLEILNEKLRDYELVWDFSEGYAAVAKDGKIGFIDKSGKVVIPLKWEYKDEYIRLYKLKFEDGRCLIPYNDYSNYTLIDNDGKELYSAKSISIQDIGNRRLMTLFDRNSKASTYWISKDSITEAEIDDMIISENYNYNIPYKKTNYWFSLENLCDGGIVGWKKLAAYGYKTTTSTNYTSDGNGLLTLINTNTNKYGIVDQKGNIVVPFEYDNNIMMCYGLLIETVCHTTETEAGPFTFPVYCNVYKDGRLLHEKLSYITNEDNGFFCFMGESKESIREKFMVSPDELDIPKSVENTVFIDSEGRKVTRFPFGKNYLRYNIDKESIGNWQIEDEEGNLVYPNGFDLEDRLANGIVIEVTNLYRELYYTETGDTISSGFKNYVYYGIVKMTDRFPKNFYPLCDYDKKLSEKDNYLNCHYTREMTSEQVEKRYTTMFNVMKHDGGMVLPYTVDEVYNFSDGLLRLKIGDRYFFVDENGNGIIEKEKSKS